MKRTLSLSGYFLLTSLLLVTACSKKGSSEPLNLSVDKNALNCEREGAEQVLNIVSNSAWTAEVSANADWLTIDRTSGSKSAALKITTITNTAFAGRTATLTLKATGVADVIVTIAQKGILAWEKTIAAETFTESNFNDVVAVTDGFVAVGRKTTGFYIAKISLDGQTVLKENIITDHQDGKSIVANPDGSFVVTGTTSTGNNPGGGNIFAIKLDANLQPVAGKLFLLDTPFQDFPTTIIRTSDGGYAIAGFKGGSMYAVKLDADLQSVPGKEFIYNPASISSVAYGIAETADGGFAIAGTSTDPSNQNIHILKLDANLAMVPGKGFIIDESPSDNVACLKPTSDGGFIIAGYTMSNNILNMYAEKLNASLQPVPGKKLIFNKGVSSNVVDIIEKADHGFMVLANIYNNDNSDRDFLVNALDQDLQPVTGREIRIHKKATDVPSAIEAAPDGGFVMAGSFFDNTSASLYLTRFNK